VVTGDAAKGEAYFDGAGGCKACHSVAGDLAHIAKKYQPDQLQNRFLWPGSGGFGQPEKQKKVTVTLASGKSISGSLKRLDDFEVSLYDAAGEYHSWPRSQVKVEVEDRLLGHRKLLDQYSDADMHNLLAYLVTLK